MFGTFHLSQANCSVGEDVKFSWELKIVVKLYSHFPDVGEGRERSGTPTLFTLVYQYSTTLLLLLSHLLHTS